MQSETISKIALSRLKEAFEGNEKDHFYTGLLSTIDSINSETASKVPVSGKTSIAGHVKHIDLCFDWLKNAMNGNDNAVDWSKDWQITTIDDSSWQQLRFDLRQKYISLCNLVESMTSWEENLFGIIGFIAHTAYHTGSVRQMMQKEINETQ